MPRHPDTPQFSRRTEMGPGFTADERDAYAHWQHLVDARLIGNITELSAETLARHAANETALGLRPRRGHVA